MGCCHSFCKTCCPCCEITCFCCKKFVKRTPSPPISNNGKIYRIIIIILLNNQILGRTSSAAKSNTIGPMPVKATQQTAEVLQTPDILNMQVLPKEKQNVDCLDQIAREATFSDIVKADISVIQIYAILSESKNISSISLHILTNDVLFLRSLCLRSYNTDPINFIFFLIYTR
jgi:hypothetical protein